MYDALRIDPYHVDAYNKRGTVLAQRGNFSEAIADFNSALQYDANFADAYYNRGLAHSGLGNAQAAIADYD